MAVLLVSIQNESKTRFLVCAEGGDYGRPGGDRSEVGFGWHFGKTIVEFATGVVWWVRYCWRKGIGKFQKMKALEFLHPAMVRRRIIGRGWNRNII